MSEQNGVVAESQTVTLRILRGAPRAEEVAALAAVMSRRAAVPAAEPTAASAWSDPARLVRRPLPHGPGAWRASAWRS